MGGHPPDRHDVRVVAEVTGSSEHPRFREAALLAVLQTLREAIRRGRGRIDRIDFEVADWRLWACVGPGDDSEPVLTVMLRGED